MIQNIVQVYENSEEILKELDRKTNQAFKRQSGHFSDMIGGKALDLYDNYFYESSSLQGPVVLPDDIAKGWLQSNYLWATHFSPGGLPGIGETGADIISRDDQTYLTANFNMLIGPQVALNHFREVENDYAGWCSKENDFYEAFYSFAEELKKFPELAESFKEVKVNNRRSRTPTSEFIKYITRLNSELIDGELKVAAVNLEKLLADLSGLEKIEETFVKIRKGHKGVPYIRDDGMIFIPTPVASGGICAHTHPGYDDPLHAMPSVGDISILAAQSGTDKLFDGHIGGGETQGDAYILHIPKRYFFDEVQELVQEKADYIIEKLNGSDEENYRTLMEEVDPLKKEVLKRRITDIMSNQILGFKYSYGSKEQGDRELVVNPVIARSEFEKHKKFLGSKIDLPIAEYVILSGGNGFLFKDIYEG